MATWYADLFTAVRAAVVAACPEVAANGVYHEAELQHVSFWRKQEDLQLPCAAMGYSLIPSDEWGADNDAEAGELRIYYIAADLDTVPMDTLLGKLEAIRTQFRGTALTCGQVVAFPSIDFSALLWTNQLFAQLQRPCISGLVRVQIVVND